MDNRSLWGSYRVTLKSIHINHAYRGIPSWYR